MGIVDAEEKKEDNLEDNQQEVSLADKIKNFIIKRILCTDEGNQDENKNLKSYNE